MSDDVSFMRSHLVDSKFVIHEADDVLQKKELWPVELHIRQHVAHQGVPVIGTALGHERSNTLVSGGLPRVILLLLASVEM